MSQKNADPKASPTEEGVKEALSPISALLSSEIWPREAGVRFNTWEAVPREGTPVEHVLRPDYWSNVSAKLQPASTVLLYPADGAWYLEVLVWDSGQNWANVTAKAEPLMRPKFSAAPGVLDNFEVRRHPSKGWQAIERSTGRVLKENFANAEEVRQWFLSNQRALRS